MYTRLGLGFVSFSKVTRVILQDKANLKKRKVIGIINEFFSGDYKPLFITLEGSAKKKGHCRYPRVITRGSICYYRCDHSFSIH